MPKIEHLNNVMDLRSCQKTLVEEHLPTPVILTSLLEKREMAATALEIVNNTQAGSTVKCQSVNVINGIPPNGCYGYRPEMMTINEHGKYSKDKPEHVMSILRTHVLKPQLSKQGL